MALRQFDPGNYPLSIIISSSFLPFSVIRYFWFGLLGLSGIVISSNPNLSAGFSMLILKCFLSFMAITFSNSRRLILPLQTCKHNRDSAHLFSIFIIIHNPILLPGSLKNFSTGMYLMPLCFKSFPGEIIIGSAFL